MSSRWSGVVDAVGRRDRPAVVAVVPLVPPAVEDREVQAAVERGLHARRAARLVGTQRVVQPDVAAGVERLGHRDVVVGQEHDAVPDLGVVGEAHHLLDQLLAALVGRVRLAGDDQLHRALGVQQEPLEPLGVAQHQRQPLVRRDAAREADGEHVRVERGVDPLELGRQPRRAASRTCASASGRRRRAAGAAPAWCPRSSLPGTLSTTSNTSAGAVRVRVGAGARAVGAGQVEDLARHPGRGVHAVGDRGDRPLVGVELRPQAAEHAAADHAVQLGDAVGALREPEAHHGHVEHRRVAAVVVLGAEREDAVDRDARRRRCRRRSTARSGRSGKRSMPAGTGVCVVKTVPARETSSAASKVERRSSR